MEKVDAVSLGMMNQFAKMRDNDLRRAAYIHASEAVNDKKHRNIDKGILYSIPVVAGLSEATRTAPRIARVGNFGLGAASWALAFLTIGAVDKVQRGLEKYSKSLRDFNENHSTMAMLTTLGVSIAGYMAVTRGASKYLNKNSEKIIKTVAPYVDKLSQKLEASKLLNKASELSAKVPSSFKDVSKVLLSWAPIALLLSRFTHRMSHEQARVSEYIDSYTDLKTQQSIVREALASAEKEQ